MSRIFTHHGAMTNDKLACVALNVPCVYSISSGLFRFVLQPDALVPTPALSMFTMGLQGAHGLCVDCVI
jgi:hypothetical protein